MSFNSNPGSQSYVASEGQTDYDFNFKIFLDTDVLVYQTLSGQVPNDANDLLTLATNYTVSIVGDSGGKVTLNVGAGVGDTIVVRRNLPLTRDVEYQTSGDLLATTLNDDQDYQTYLILDGVLDNARALTLPDTAIGVSSQLPNPEAFKLMRWNEDANALENIAVSDNSTFTNILNVDSIADLATVNVLLYETVNVRGYYQPNDGGGGVFNYDTTQSGTNDGGTVLNGWVRQYTGRLNVKWFGAKGDGVADDTISMQLAHDTDYAIFYPRGVYFFTNITIGVGGIIGEGMEVTTLNTIHATSDSITFTGSPAALNGEDMSKVPMFWDFYLTTNIAKTAGAGIVIEPATTETLFGTYTNLGIYNIPTSMKFVKSSLYTITNCKFLGYLEYGLDISNTNDVDRGDSQITSCIFSTNQASGSRQAINYKSSAGLKFTGNKIIGGVSGLVLSYVGAAVTTGDLIITGNSIEGLSDFAVYLSRFSGTGNFGAIVITGNQMANQGTCIGTDASGAISQVTIVGNDLASYATGKHCVYLENVAHFNVSGNTLSGNASLSTGVSITASSSNGKIGKNTYKDLLATVDNQSASTFIDGDKQSGSVGSITTGSAFGVLYHGTSAVVFPTAYTVKPDVYCNAAGGAGIAGGFGGYATNISLTGFTYNLVGVDTGATLECLWTASGVV